MPDLVLPDYIVSDSENRLPTCPFHIADDKGSGESSRDKILFLEDVPFNPNKYHPMRLHLQYIDWSVWGTITWNDSFRRLSGYDAEKARRIDFKNLLTKTRSDVGLRGKDIFYYHATEYGKSGENHFHFLIWNTKPLRVSHSLLAERMQYFWNKDFVRFDSRAKSGGSGLSVIAPYDKNTVNPAAQYCFKREFDGCGKERERYDDMSDNLFRYLLNRTSK